MLFMKNSTIINIVLAIAVAGLYMIHLTGNSKDKSASPDKAARTNHPLTIAYVKMDSIYFTYELAKKLNTEFSEKKENFRKEYTDKRIKFERDAANFQEKVQRGGFLTEDRAKQEQERLVGAQQEIQKLDYDLTQRLSEMQSQINQQIADSISSYMKSYNEIKKYDFILNSGSMLEGSPKFNITKEVTQGLNDRYKSFTK